MSIIKKTALQSFSISLLVLAITACGGGDDDKQSVTPASLTTTTDIAKAVAGIQAAKTIFDVVISNNQAGIEESITNGDVNKDVSCGTSLSAGTFKITPNTITAYAKDGTGVSSMCLEDGEKFDGTLVYQCNNASCDSALSTATNLVWGDTNKAIDLKVNGTSTGSVGTSMPQDEFRGTASIIKSGASTTFSSYDRLVTQYFAKNRIVGYGGLTVSGGSSTNCIDGTYAYSVRESLVMNSGTQRISGGLIRISSGGNSEGPEAGTVLFNADGSVKVKLANGIETTVSKTEFESYCGLKEAYDFSEKL